MNRKKIMWILLLIFFVIAIIIVAILAKPRDTSNDNSVAVKQVTDSRESKNNTSNVVKQNTSKEYKRSVLNDGILYSESGEKLRADKIIGTEYFDTTINDMYLYPYNYVGEKIEIEGFYLVSEPYTFVGRYSASSVCPYCTGGFSYIQYEFDGKIEEILKEQETWIKLIGTWEKGKINYGTKENPNYDDYYYLKVLSFEIMNEKGEDTVKN